MATKSYEKGKYTESKDKVKDAAMTKNLTPEQKKRFEAEDKKHAAKKKPKTMQEDKKIDAKIIKKIVKTTPKKK
jgi:hypothetical protein